MEKVILAFLVVFLTINDSFSLNQEDQVLIYNIGLGGIIGSIGSVVNKKRDQTWNKALLKGFIQGSLGGFISYQGKRLTHQINRQKNLGYGWLAKIIHSVGTSVVENAASSKNFWESWNMHFGFLRIESEPLLLSLRVKLLPYATYSFVRASFIGKFNIEKTFKIGTPYFSTNNHIYNRFSAHSFWNDMTINEECSSKYTLIAHEYIHNLQFKEYLALNNNFFFVDKKLQNYEFYKRLSNYIYIDMPFYGVAYELEGRHNDKWYFKNFFEMEAEHFATLEKVPIPK